MTLHEEKSPNFMKEKKGQPALDDTKTQMGQIVPQHNIRVNVFVVWQLFAKLVHVSSVEMCLASRHGASRVGDGSPLRE